LGLPPAKAGQTGGAKIEGSVQVFAQAVAALPLLLQAALALG
jgi:hypothetical protein